MRHFACEVQRLIGVPGLPGEGWLADAVGLVAVAQCRVLRL